MAALAEVAGLGERKAKSLLEAAQAWVAEHAAAVAAEEAIAGEDELSASEDHPGDGEVVGDSQEPKAPSTAGE